MGILNVTPDSFSDGGQFLDPGAAVARAAQLVAEGADLVDVGGESTRPGAQPVDAAEERRRVIPVIERLAGTLPVPISIDTCKPAVAAAALEAGAVIVNDIGAARQERAMWRLVAEKRAGYVAMHMQGTPDTMQRQPAYGDVLGEVDAFFARLLGQVRDCGVEADQVVLDVGLGFGKTAAHNLALLAGVRTFARHGRPLLLGASRKSLISQVTGVTEAGQRLPGSLACACWAVEQGVQIIRAHDVAATVQALRMTEAIAAVAPGTGFGVETR